MVADLERRVRRAYEVGRLGSAAPWVLLAVPFAAVSLLSTPLPPVNVGLGVLLGAAIVALRWRGRGWSRGIGLGLGIGLVPLVVPTVARLQGACCGTGAAACSADCLTACVVGGLGAGVLLGVHLVRRQTDNETIVSAAIVGTLVGTLGCVAGGFTGVGVLATSLAAVSIGGVMLRPAPRGT